MRRPSKCSLVRHGPMVLNVCRQLLRDPHDVEDAFQAVFLVLVRKAGTDPGRGLARSVALHGRQPSRRPCPREPSTDGRREISAAAELAESPPDDTLDRLESAVVIQEELGRLPERLRAPLVLCYLQGMTHELAAGQLGCPVGTVRSRLSRGRAQLLRRITRRGLALSAAGLVSALESNARAAAVPPIVTNHVDQVGDRWVSESAARVGGLGALGIGRRVTGRSLERDENQEARDLRHRVGVAWAHWVL